MKYYSEETVKALLENVYLHTLEDCPSIEIPDVHGDLCDKQELLESAYDLGSYYLISSASVVLEAST